MKKVSLIILLVILLLSACTSPQATIFPTSTVTPTPRLSATTRNATQLYQGPGNLDYAVLADLPAGDVVYLTATFGDFAYVEYKSLAGYIAKADLGQLPDYLQELPAESVPPLTRNLLDSFYDPSITWSNGEAIVNRLDSNEWGGYSAGPIVLTKPFSVTVDLAIEGDFGDIILYERSTPQTDPNSRLIIDTNGSIALWNDPAATSPIYEKMLNGIQGQLLSIFFSDPNGKNIIFKNATGEVLDSIDLVSQIELGIPDGLFPNGLLYFGDQTAPLSSLTIKQLEFAQAPNGTFEQPPVTLRTLADQRGILLGVHVVNLTDLTSQSVSIANFNGGTVDFGWDSIEPERGKFDFSGTDQAVEFALRNNMKVTGLHLVWGDSEHLPDWLVHGNFNHDELVDILQEYIDTVAVHYRGKIHIWSIANEFNGRQMWNADDFWRQHLGSDYVEMAFRWASEADPDALLMLNQDNDESPESANADGEIIQLMLDSIKKWKDAGVPLDAVGMQMHLLQSVDMRVPSKQSVIETMQQFAALGVQVYVTEFDVNMHAVLGTQQERWDYQAQVYGDMLAACLESGVCQGFSIYGVADPDSWYGSCCLNISNADPLLFDDQYQPKPAYEALLEVLQQHTP